uniref:Uncharacterized protein n=1 Tax=Cryptomonas curvata TaxID=233186 RepID=A0A7S0MMI0_9CRYP|mmetsp:Transcript_44861/g.93976  ORF Transcript_44861/g.93976 Transcript_44861/m.93976 type:complete len:652 (+) Transcript_44861:301-2256(+)
MPCMRSPAPTRERPKPWTPHEDQLLLSIISGAGKKDWSNISLSLGDRTGKQCRQRYNYHLEQEYKKGGWTSEEDRTIIRLQAELGNSWSKIAKVLPGRNDNSVKNRWYCALLRQDAQSATSPSSSDSLVAGPGAARSIKRIKIARSEKSFEVPFEAQKCREPSAELQAKKVQPKIRTTPWTWEEDQELLNVVHHSKRRDWQVIAQQLHGGRTGKQCRQRFNYHLQHDFKTGGWTREEDQIIFDEQSRLGNCWSRIARLLPGRSDNAVKNRWYCALMQRRSRRGSLSPAPADSRGATCPDTGETLSSSSSPEPDGMLCCDYGAFLQSECRDNPPSMYEDTGSDFCKQSPIGDIPIRGVCAHFSSLGEESTHGVADESRLPCTNDIASGTHGAATTTPPPLDFGDSACACKELLNVRDVGTLGRAERKRAREDPAGLESATACLESAEDAAVPGSIRRGSVAVADGVHPRGNWARRLSRVETPASLSRHVRHSWLLRRLLSDSYAALSQSLDSGVSAATPARRNFAECLRSEELVDAPGGHRDTQGELVHGSERRVDASEEGLNAPVEDWLESAAEDISGGGGSGGRLMWPTSMEDSSIAWTTWAAEEGCLADSGPNLSAVAEGEPVAEPAAEELLLSCPAQFLVSLPWDGSG